MIMNTSNSPASVVSQPFAKANREWSDLSHTLLASYASGFETPALCLSLTGNSTVVLNMEHALQTNPTVTPVFDSQRVNVRAFYYPQRLCTRGLYGNNYMELDEIEQLEIPTISMVDTNLGVTGREIVLPGSLLNRLGIPSMFMGKTFVPLDRRRVTLDRAELDGSTAVALATGATPELSWNLSPIVGYYDICAHYLANPYDPEIPMPEYKLNFYTDDNDEVQSSFNVSQNTIYNLYDLREWLLNVKGVSSSVATSTVPSQVSLFSKETNSNLQSLGRGLRGPLGPLTQTATVVGLNSELVYNNVLDAPFTKTSSQLGLFPATYMEDNLTTYLDSEEINTLMSVDLGSDVESYRLGKSIWNRMLRGILRGKKYDDWIEIQTGAKLKMSDHPIFVGADYFNVTFNDVLNNSASSNEVPLGASASRGSKGRGNRRKIAFTVQEPGYLFVLISLVPYVSYSGNVPKWLDYKTLADFPLPAYAGRNFRDLRVEETVFTDNPNLNTTVIGKQPLYYDYMTAHDRLGGIFDTSLLDTYTFKKTYDFNWNGMMFPSGDIAQANIIGSTYIQKGMYDYAFPDWGQNGGENFFIKTQFDLKVLQPIPRDIIKTRM